MWNFDSMMLKTADALSKYLIFDFDIFIFFKSIHKIIYYFNWLSSNITQVNKISNIYFEPNFIKLKFKLKILKSFESIKSETFE